MAKKKSSTDGNQNQREQKCPLCRANATVRIIKLANGTVHEALLPHGKCKNRRVF